MHCVGNMFMLHCSIYLFIALYSMTTSTTSASHMVQFILSNTNVQNMDYDDDELDWLDKFDSGCDTVFIIHGWKNTAFDSEFVEMAEAYRGIPNACYNTIRVNWPDGSEPFLTAGKAIPKVAEEVATFSRKLKKLALLNSTDLVGFSLGAHLAGLVGRTLKQDGLVKEIIALDPAGPGYTEMFKIYGADQLQPTDADIVIALSTNSGCAGTSKRLGSINFLANGGNTQTGCAPADCICSHHKAIDYFIESLTSDKFVGTGGQNETKAIFGPGMNADTAAGDYYFETNASPQYARG